MKKTIDYELTLQESVKANGQAETARMIGVGAQAVKFMLESEREIFLKRIDSDWYYGEFKWWQRGKGSNGRPVAQRAKSA